MNRISQNSRRLIDAIRRSQNDLNRLQELCNLVVNCDHVPEEERKTFVEHLKPLAALSGNSPMPVSLYYAGLNALIAYLEQEIAKSTSESEPESVSATS